MITALLAELDVQPRRRAFRGTTLAMAAVVLALVMLRFVTASADTTRAVRDAEAEAARLTEMFGDLTVPAHTYVEPRYMFAGQFPHDLAGVVIGFALLAFVGGALLVGGDWRTGAVRMSLTGRSSRAVPCSARVVVWAASSMVVAVLLAVVLTASMLAVAALRGSTSGVDLLGTVFMLARGGLVVLAAAGAGAALGTVLRSDVAVVVLVLAYVLLVETLVPVLVMGFRTPGAVVHAFVRSEDLSRSGTFTCDVPRCPEPVLAGVGGWSGYMLIAGILVASVVMAVLGARRPVWR
ncbi:hypothetical protein KQI48_06125 [Cellulomonas hominis]|uniref:hypothetical protein n=1 Tax=Cellulomonas hominis TaxID=156981 RepID=UPI001C125CF7|nr:hypothetical protein [Cellulomonas hominis]MBU5422236.1 hypothetical protein [Cellulomonas hominis]